MFTGIVKLAQIDDYITPAQNCIQPKIMKKSQAQTKATVTLNDCLACSGCITSAESILVDQMSLVKFKQLLSQPDSFLFIVLSPQSLVSLTLFYKQTNPRKMCNLLQKFLQKQFPSIKAIINESQGIRIAHELVLQEFNQNYAEQKVLLCSECPGWVCYAEKTQSAQITQFMSKVKSPQQIMARLIKQKMNENSNSNNNANSTKVVSIMPCFDKKLEAIRFDLDEKTKQVDLTLATNEIQNLLNETNKQWQEFLLNHNNDDQNESTQKYLKENLALSQHSQNFSEINFLQDQTSNGYVSFLLNRLRITDVSQKQIKNSDFIEIKGINPLNGKQIKMAKCYGFLSIQKVVSMIKRKKCPYSYIQIMACPGGCYSGGGQIRYEDKKQKDVITEFKSMEEPFVIARQNKQNTVQNKPQSTIDQLDLLNENDLNKIKKYDFSANYKPIEKSFSSSVTDW